MKKGTYPITPEATAYFKKCIRTKDRLTVSNVQDDDGKQWIIVINGFISFKFPAGLYQELLQPATLREVPAAGTGFDSGANKLYNHDDNVNLWNNAIKTATTPAIVLPYTKISDTFSLRLISIENTPAYINNDFFDMVNANEFYFKGSGACNPFVGVSQDENFTVLMLPIRATTNKYSNIDKLIADTKNMEGFPCY